ncbi:MAG TPA: hypothetical protein VMU51_35260 [Mycobacteriales bacterium]|nr:hypothetical protein [Mycobacteriales bacterium]
MADPVARRLLAGAVLGLGLLGVGLAGAAPAAADGSLAVSPAKGADDTPMQVATSGGCPSPATNVLARIYGPGFGRDGENVVGNTPLGRYDQPIVLPLSQTLRASAAAQTPPVTLHGVYTLVVSCRLPLKPASYTDYVGSIEFTTPHSYRLSAKRAALPAGPRATPDPPGHATRTIAPATPPSTVDAAAPAGGQHRVDALLIGLAALGVAVLAAFGLQPIWARRRAAAGSAQTAGSIRAPAGTATASSRTKRAGSGSTAKAGTARTAASAKVAPTKVGTARTAASAKAGVAGTAASARAGTVAGAGRAAGARPAVSRRRAGRPESIATAAAAAATRAAEAKAAAAAAVAAAEAAAAEAEAAAAEAQAAETAAALARSRPTRPAGGRASDRASNRAGGGAGATRDAAEPTSGAGDSEAAPAGRGPKAAGTRAGAKRQ